MPIIVTKPKSYPAESENLDQMQEKLNIEEQKMPDLEIGDLRQGSSRPRKGHDDDEVDLSQDTPQEAEAASA